MFLFQIELILNNLGMFFKTLIIILLIILCLYLYITDKNLWELFTIALNNVKEMKWVQ